MGIPYPILILLESLAAENTPHKICIISYSAEIPGLLDILILLLL